MIPAQAALIFLALCLVGIGIALIARDFLDRIDPQ